MENYDKSQRSVFVGNIPYEATEEKLKEIFSEVGPVVSFKLVYDRENGKPKGYGFCEFHDPEMALSAMRNLNGFEIGGRTLRVDNACTEKSRMEMQQLMTGAAAAAAAAEAQESPYGEAVEPEKAPESISRAVASLPPEQMFELMKQMKSCIENNPHEARKMLHQNPQLAYALLQAQVVMRIVDPDLAVTMLHKTQPKPINFHQMTGGPAPPVMGGPGPSAGPLPVPVPGPNHAFDPMRGAAPMEGPGFGGLGFGVGNRGPGPISDFGGRRDPRSRDRDPRASRMGGPAPMGAPPVAPAQPGGGALPAHLAGADPDKAQLIMQVLKLTDEQIALLPAEQRQSIMELKKQINAGN